MKRFMFLLFIFIGCYVTPQIPVMSVFDVNPKLNNPSEHKIAVLPIKVLGNPDINELPEVTIKFEDGLKQVGFQVVDSYFVSATLKDLNIDINNDLSIDDMKSILDKLNCSLICISILEYSFVPGTGGGVATNYGARVSSRDGFYLPSSESLKIMNPYELETLLTISNRRGKGTGSLSEEIVTHIKNYYNK